MNQHSDYHKPLLENLTDGNVAVLIPPAILWWSLGIIIFLAILVSIALVYHWSAYGYNKLLIKSISFVYIIGVLFLTSLMFFGVTSFVLTV